MIWTLSVECVSGWYLEENCKRIIEIKSNSSLYDLHYAIQDAVGFGYDHPFEFYAGRNYRNRKLFFGIDLDDGDPIGSYSDLTLAQVYPLPNNLILFYHFDFGDNWYFEIRKSRKQPTEPVDGVKYPRVIEKVAPNPVQYPRWEE
ncbi:MAG: hypothetical protein ABSE72_11570 [Bacteroidales bacterium]|jgi:hypothetical protein